MNNHLKSLIPAIASLAIAGGVISSCGGGGSADSKVEKPKQLWMCSEANFKRFATQDSITYYLEKAKETGFNQVVVDVKPIQGKVLYRSEYLPYLTNVDTVEIVRDWDYLQYFVDEAHRLGLKIVASACVFPAGSPWWHRGLVYDNPEFESRTCLQYLPDGSLQPIYEDRTQVAAFLNPAREDNRELALDLLLEIINNYDIDGLALDYCRFPDSKSDFSADTKAVFEEYLGEAVDNFPADIFTYGADGEIIPGKYYKQWWAFRSGIITDFVHTVSDTLHALKPDCELNYWAASWIHAIHGNGQNWASPRSSWSKAYDFGTDEYQTTGFAPYLDNFIVGTYLERVYGPDDNESVEYGLARADTLIKGDCHVIGSIYAVNHNNDLSNPQNIENAVTACLDGSEGLMVFDIIQVDSMNLWDNIKAAIDRYEAKQ